MAAKNKPCKRLTHKQGVIMSASAVHLIPKQMLTQVIHVSLYGFLCCHVYLPPSTPLQAVTQQERNLNPPPPKKRVDCKTLKAPDNKPTASHYKTFMGLFKTADLYIFGVFIITIVKAQKNYLLEEDTKHHEKKNILLHTET